MLNISINSKAAVSNGTNFHQFLTTMHHDVNNINSNNHMTDNVLGNLSSSNANIDSNGSSDDIVDGPDKIQFTDLILVVLFCLLIIVVVIGNTLVILSVLTTRRLRTVTNLFVTSLALADWLVGIFVMPPAVAYYLMGKCSFYQFEVESI